MSGEDMALDFLAALRGDAPPPSAAAQRGPRLATIDASYSGTGAARVIFDGESVAGLRSYIPLQPVAVGQRVVLLPIGNTLVILGDVAGAFEALIAGFSARLGGGYLPRQFVYFTSNDTFTKASYPWLRALRVRLVGGGGGGGGAAATGSGVYSMGTGGGGGGYAESFITDIAGLAASVTVTRGAGGTSSAGAAGGAGGASSFGSLVAASGGGGGVVKPANTLAPYVSGGTAGVGTAGALLIRGQGGDSGNGYADLGASGAGGSSQLGGGARGVGQGSSGLVGEAGGTYGGGGGGAYNSTGQSARAGGVGGAGVVIVELFG